MSSIKEDPIREARIAEIYVDTYTEDEQALCWYYYLEQQLRFPFKAKWLRLAQSGAEVEVIGLSGEEECYGVRVQVNILYREDQKEDTFSVPLTQIEPLNADPSTTQAVEDLKYWVAQGYEI